jgi:hypothetical protein
MTNPNRNDTLKQLQAELNKVETDDADTQVVIRSLSDDLQKMIDDETGDHKSLLDQLNEAITRFEGTHPKLALAITQAINALASGGV